jgi:hypothetical protein
MYRIKNVGGQSFEGAKPGANPIKLATPTLKKWRWRNCAKTKYQFYKNTFSH